MRFTFPAHVTLLDLITVTTFDEDRRKLVPSAEGDNGPKREEVTGGRRKLHNEELHNLYSSSYEYIVSVVKSRRMSGTCSTHYVCRIIRPKARWTLIQCRHQMHIHTHTHTHIHAHTYTCMHACPCTAQPIPPLRGVLNQELNWVGWPVPFPLSTAHNQATMKCITWLKICNTTLIYLHHPQVDNNN
jgi:hypothetical protein